MSAKTNNRVKLYKEEYIMKLSPLGERVVLKESAVEETTKSGIILAGLFALFLWLVEFNFYVLELLDNI